MSAPASAITVSSGKRSVTPLTSISSPAAPGAARESGGGVSVVADEQVGDGEAVEILGAGRRDAARQVAGPATVLNRRLQSSVKDLDHAALIPGRRLSQRSIIFTFSI